MIKNLFGNHATYSYSVGQGVICIIDEDDGPSDTNTAPQVIEDLRHAGLDLLNQRVIYRDTLGTWDEIVVQDGMFSGFKSIHEKTQQDAIQKIVAEWSRP